MSRWIAFAVIFLTVIPVVLAQDSALLAAAKNPYELARYMDTHKGVDLGPLWKALHVEPAMNICAGEAIVGECSIDLITAYKPEQAILAVQTLAYEIYLRFLRQGAGWKFAGATDSYLKNHAGRHEITRIGEKTFLRISGQGASGSDWDSEVESWYDLSRLDFEPVFGFTVQGGENRFTGISREVWANAAPGLGDTGPDTIDIDVAIKLSIFHERQLGTFEYLATYERGRGQKKFTLQNAKPIAGTTLQVSNKDFELLANIDVDSGPATERMLVYALPALRAVASGTNEKDREWLRSVLKECKDTPQKRALQKLLDRTP
jgi:hypothetical protein